MPLVCGLLMMLASGGCSRDNSPTRYPVAGNVKFAGKPVPAGVICFTPDGGKDGGGVAGYATIKDGIFDTSVGGKGVSGGPQTVRISGFDGVVTSDLMPHGKPLFPDYVTKADLPKKKAACDFDVPSSGTGR